jgi:hypothetical protein
VGRRGRAKVQGLPDEPESTTANLFKIAGEPAFPDHAENFPAQRIQFPARAWQYSLLACVGNLLVSYWSNWLFSGHSDPAMTDPDEIPC